MVSFNSFTRIVVAISATFLPNISQASETVTYSYDAQGRLIDATHSGTGPNSGLDIRYQYDQSENRKIQNVTGSKNAGQQVVVMLSANGFYIIPANP